MPFWPFGKKKEDAPTAGVAAERKAGSGLDEFDPNEAPANVQTTGSVEFGDGAASTPSMTGICQPVGSPIEAVAACFWQLAPGKKGTPRYHIDF